VSGFGEEDFKRGDSVILGRAGFKGCILELESRAGGSKSWWIQELVDSRAGGFKSWWIQELVDSRAGGFKSW